MWTLYIYKENPEIATVMVKHIERLPKLQPVLIKVTILHEKSLWTEIVNFRKRVNINI